MSGKSKKVKGTKQTLEYVEQPEKLHVKAIKCKNAKQKEFLKTLDEKIITVCTGSPGSGKTLLALYSALKALEKGQIECIYLVKPVVQIPGEEVGFLRGSLEEKLDPVNWSFFGNLDKLIGESWRKKLMAEKKIISVPIAFLRGVNLDHARVIVDEAQNITLSTFKTIITRIGEGSSFCVCGDIEQQDIKDKKHSCLHKLIELFKDDGIVGAVTFSDDECVRNPCIPYILNKLRTLEQG